jgi:hypothetical protein
LAPTPPSNNEAAFDGTVSTGGGRVVSESKFKLLSPGVAGPVEVAIGDDSGDTTAEPGLDRPESFIRIFKPDDVLSVGPSGIVSFILAILIVLIVAGNGGDGGPSKERSVESSS